MSELERNEEVEETVVETTEEVIEETTDVCDAEDECTETDVADVTLESLKAAVLEDGIIDAEEVETIEAVIYEDGKIDKEEADFLFELNDAVSGKENAPEWKELFVKALTDYVLADDETPGVVDADETAYLVDAIEGDGKVDETELALLVNIIDKAESCEDAFIAFVLKSATAAILEDGIVDAEEVEMLSTIVYGKGGAAGSDVDRTEADMLFEINDAVSGKDNAPEWKEFFIEAITKHVLEDEETPGVVDAEEGEWLISKVEGDGEYDEIEKDLLRKIKADSKEIVGKLQFKIDMFVA